MVRRFAAALVVAAALHASNAHADPPDQVIAVRHAAIDRLLTQPPSPQRDVQLAAEVDALIDYDELTRRCFGGHWSALSSSQRKVVTTLMTEIVRSSYLKNLRTLLGWKVTFVSTQSKAPDVIVRTDARSVRDPQAPPMSMDYALQGASGGSFRVVDIIAQGSSTTSNYNREIHRLLTASTQGYSHLVQKLKDKIARQSASANASSAGSPQPPPTATSAVSSRTMP
jgi:ABC-type transporter MlaC component